MVGSALPEWSPPRKNPSIVVRLVGLISASAGSALADVRELRDRQDGGFQGFPALLDFRSYEATRWGATCWFAFCSDVA